MLRYAGIILNLKHSIVVNYNNINKTNMCMFMGGAILLLLSICRSAPLLVSTLIITPARRYTGLTRNIKRLVETRLQTMVNAHVT